MVVFNGGGDGSEQSATEAPARGGSGAHPSMNRTWLSFRPLGLRTRSREQPPANPSLACGLQALPG